ncbi:MliC family protein [Phenylobacterium sp. J367]|uniref:MliC family protein n=1 Tax=Phenylobacterium sp. J367 TaxID=2898435 RepID=UPI00215093D1|nr:MliC family protein [Phenylobacterium sp. J367]MCR5880500.1 MliC family protein [Phenylobacterium sp. J367]
MRAGPSTLLILAAALAGCTTVTHPTEPASVLHCENGETVEVRYAGDMALVVYKNRKHTMRTVISGSGARYIGDGMEWWSKGFEEGMIAPVAHGAEMGMSDQRVTCRAGPPPP